MALCFVVAAGGARSTPTAVPSIEARPHMAIWSRANGLSRARARVPAAYCMSAASSGEAATAAVPEKVKEGRAATGKDKGAAEGGVYRHTVNLPETGFSQRANAVEREPQLQAFWEENQVYQKLSRNNPGDKFVLHDGPPYANGTIHMGHAMNKVLKDFINRYQLLQGRRAALVPGWDCHGLPIELKVLQSKKLKKKRLEPIELRREAAMFARETVEEQKQQFMRLGVWADWDSPYLTLQKEYEAAQIGVFGQMVKKGHIYRGKKPVYWSPSSRTALAEAELEYPEGHVSRSVYAGFQVSSGPDAQVVAQCEPLRNILQQSQNENKPLRLAIWTTTPWTLPANLAVAVNAELDYSIVADDEGASFLVIAEDLVESVSAKLGRSLRKVSVIKGKDLAGLEYQHCMMSKKTCRVVIGGDYITTESGTGLVHTAPGHGQEDYIVGQREGLEMLSPVDDAGKFTEEAGEDGEFVGLAVLREGNEACVRKIEKSGVLLLEEPYAHKYPYDWRTKKPTIFRCTEQWFASVEGFRSEALRAVQGVQWIPASGEKRIHNMIEGRSDWCISRQRVWGVPIPVFYDPQTNQSVMDDEIIDAVQKLFAARGSDAWYECEADEILPEKFRGRGLVKGSDTMDVWFDSGCSWACVAGERPELQLPADLYLEGSDQHRGWFQSSLLTSVATTGAAPYATVLTHGFLLDEKGMKMSKSIGNVVDPNDVINGGTDQKRQPPFGADVLRLWVSSVDYTGDAPIGPNILKQVADGYRKLRNTLRYLIGNLHDFVPERGDMVAYEELSQVDRYILWKTDAVCREVQAAYDTYAFYKVYQIVQRFAVADLSNFYLDTAKDRLYISAPGDRQRRRSCQTVMYWILMDLLKLLAPILSHTCEDAWLNLPEGLKSGKGVSIFMDGWLDRNAPYRGVAFDAAPTWERLLGVRDCVNRTLELARMEKVVGASLDAQIRLFSSDPELQRDLEQLGSGTAKLGSGADVDSLAALFIASDARAVSSRELVDTCAHVLEDQELSLVVGVDRASGAKCERCWCYDTAVGQGANSEDSAAGPSPGSAHPTLCPRCLVAVQSLGL
ncbi:Isoleucine--tRNA ligase [Porphyridium purpureum]|uniref:isoleucine--tRNA ligase n=1 Tax=Porphyridium purpureum TaxID=35688 RepID=A0A5J4Z9Y1_PORPP|nr:Isoleucine--tRNA ligase [Porphyridium purpureum]|eukprot:POR7254..scf295_1